MTTTGAELATSAEQLSAIVEGLRPGGIELAYHAALPVVVDSDLLHLIRINFLVDPPHEVGYESEAELLLSPLFREVSDGLFEIAPQLRNLLLLGLNSAFDRNRVERLASLLQRYSLRTDAWRRHPSLQLAQEVTAYSLLDPEAGEAWLEGNAPRAAAGAPIGPNWFVAMRQRRLSYPPADATFDGVVTEVVDTVDRPTSVRILRSLARLPGATSAVEALRRLTEEPGVVGVPPDVVPRPEPTMSPAMARRRVRLAIREARERAGLTQAQVAKLLDWSNSKVTRIESGEVTINPNDLRVLLTGLLRMDADSTAELVELARISRQRNMWWDEAPYRSHLTWALRRVIEIEDYASIIRCWSATLVPELLQTGAVRDLVLQSAIAELTPDEVDARRAAHARRRDAFLNRSPLPTVLVVMEESVLHRNLGNADIARAQLLDLHRLIRQGRVQVRIIPMDGTWMLVPGFELLELSRADEDFVVYTSDGHTDTLIDNPRAARYYAERFELLWSAALEPPGSADLILEAANSLR